jgi:site-specific DNA-methyltransferase (adenine-specific)
VTFHTVSTTACKWDSIIPLDKLWEQYKRIIKDSGPIILTASQPFTTKLISSNYEMYRYNLVWDKTRGCNFQNAKRQPMKQHEDICIFYKRQPVYNPQFWYSKPYKTNNKLRKNKIEGLSGGSAANYCTATISEDGKRYPLSIIKIARDSDRLHPTQKPVALMEYLIKTYTNENNTVLDNCMGSGTTGVACQHLNRKFIGIELDEGYFNIAKERIEQAHETKELF